MITSERIIEYVENYLLKLGYQKEMMVRNVSIGHYRVDLVVYDGDNPRIAVEIRNEENFPKQEEIETLKFHPYVRTTQYYAKSLSTPYYLLSDGKSFLWFATNELGRPQLLANPIYPMVNVDLNLKTLSKSILVRIFNELREHFFRHLGAKYLDEVAIIIFAKLLSDQGETRLKTSLIEGYSEYSQPYEIITRDLLNIQGSQNTTLFNEAFRILDRISFKDALPLDLLFAIDDVFLNQTEIKLPRWVTSFLAHLAMISPKDNVLDIHSNYGDVIPAALTIEQTAKIWTISRSHTNALWAIIQQLIMGYNGQTPIIGNMPPHDIYKSQSFPNPQKIIVIPPIGVRIPNTGQDFMFGNKSTFNSEELYLQLSIEWVQTGGRIVAIVPDGLLLAKSSQWFRNFLYEHVQILGVISLGSFMPQTSLRASILILDKLPPNQLNKTFMAELKQINEQSTFNCFEIPQIVSIIEAFRGLKENIEHSPASVAWWVTSDKLNINNLIPSHYIPPEIGGHGHLSSPFPTIQLTKIAEVNRGLIVKLDPDGDLPVIGPAAVRPLLLDISNLGRTSLINLKSSPRFVQSNDVVLNIINTYRGAAALVTSDLVNAIVNQHIIIIRPKSSNVIPAYLAIALNSKYVKQQFKMFSSGSVIPSLTLETVREILVPLPDIETQNEIVEEIRLLQTKWVDAEKVAIDIKSKMDKVIQNLEFQEGKK